MDTINIDEILKVMIEKRASDMHLKVGRPPLIRITGKLIPMELSPLSETGLESIVDKIMPSRHKLRFQEKNEIDFSYISEDIKTRVNLFRQRGSIEIIMRHIPAKIPTVDELNLPLVLSNITKQTRGLVLLTGTVGSGKSTTIASLISTINRDRECHIVSIEDPIEFTHDDMKASVTQRELGIDTESYAVALKYVLRQDPDVIFIGEMRDLETVAAAISAAETGHLVFSTLHTIDAVQTVDRIIDFFPATQQTQIRAQFASTINAVVSQRLIETKDGKGRVPAVEVMLGTPTIKSLIREGKIKEIRANIQAGTSQYGMQTFDQSLTYLYKRDLISYDSAVSSSTSPNDMKLMLSGIVSSATSAQEHLA
jgi:twitching motility protein PilT